MKYVGFFFLLSFGSFPPAWSQSPLTIYKNNSSVQWMQTDRLFEAKQALQNEVIENPDLSALKYNYAQTFEKSNDPDTAIHEYLGAAKKTKDTDLQFQSFFNAARLYGEKKQIPEALKYYQLALDLKPDSIETKTNIELLIQNGGGEGSDNNKDKKESQDSKDQKDPKDSKDKKEQNKNAESKKEDQKPQGPPEQKKQPQKFKSEELSEQDVRRILEELKRQEDQIRKKINEQKTQESPVGKDW